MVLFIVLGMTAFAVDITNGTLYFPGSGGHSSGSTGTEHMTVIRDNPDEPNGIGFQEIAKNHTGISIRLDQRNVKISEFDRSENIEAKLMEIGKSGYKVGFDDLRK